MNGPQHGKTKNSLQYNFFLQNQLRVNLDCNFFAKIVAVKERIREINMNRANFFSLDTNGKKFVKSIGTEGY